MAEESKKRVYLWKIVIIFEQNIDNINFLPCICVKV